jgi:HEAT repeat protein
MESNQYSIKELSELMLNDELKVEDKLKALKCIIKMKEKATPLVPKLIRFIKQNNYPEILSFAIEALGEIGSASEPAIPSIGAILNDYKLYDSFDYIQNYAATSLGKIDSEKAVPFLINALKDPDSQGPCLASINALAMLKNKATSAVPSLNSLRKKPDYKDYYPLIDKALTEILSKR